MVDDPRSPWPLLAIIRCVEEPYRGRSDAQDLARRAASLDRALAEPHVILAQLTASLDFVAPRVSDPAGHQRT